LGGKKKDGTKKEGKKGQLKAKKDFWKNWNIVGR
jgi:hypothetical protein